MRSVALFAPVMNVGVALAIVAIAVGATLRIRLLVHQKKSIFPQK
jgi:hypothetical protein